MIEKKDIEKLASLARIQVNEEEKDSLASSIESILEYVGQVQHFEVSSVVDTPLQRNIMREDVVTHTSGEYTENLLSLAPFREGNYLKVKKILG